MVGKRGSTAKRRRLGQSSVVSDAPDTQPTPETQDTQDTQETAAPEEPTQEEEMEEAGDTEVSAAAKKKKLLLTEEQEDTLVEFIWEHPSIYNKGKKDYRDVDKKSALWRDQSQLMGIPGKKMSIHFFFNLKCN